MVLDSKGNPIFQQSLGSGWINQSMGLGYKLTIREPRGEIKQSIDKVWI